MSIDDLPDDGNDHRPSSEQSAYEGRPDNPPADTAAGRRGAAAGGDAHVAATQAPPRPNAEAEREGGGAPRERR